MKGRVHIYKTVARTRMPRKRLTRLGDLVLRGEKRRGAVSLIFVSDSQMRRMNQKYRRRHRTTDVLSFAMEDDDDPLLGEVYISVPQARRNARSYGITLSAEVLHLFCHGLLHLCGVHHDTKAERMVMEAKERQYLLALSNGGGRMTIVLLLLGIHFLYYISYLFSVAASGLYLSDYDEQKFLFSLSERRRAAVHFLLDNPKLLAVSATVVQSATLVVATVLWYSIGSRLALEGGLDSSCARGSNCVWVDSVLRAGVDFGAAFETGARARSDCRSCLDSRSHCPGDDARYRPRDSPESQRYRPR